MHGEPKRLPWYETDAKAGPRPRTCMHVTALRPEAEHACFAAHTVRTRVARLGCGSCVRVVVLEQYTGARSEHAWLARRTPCDVVGGNWLVEERV
eukprot:355477-Chlamydomonas_euryale.AAC.1